MLIVVEVTFEGRKIFLTVQQGDKESATTCCEIFKDLKARGLSKDFVQLGIMDGLPDLKTVFLEEFPNAKVQRCQVHVAQNVLTKVSKKLKPKVADSLRDIFYAGSRPEAVDAFDKFLH